MTDSPFRLAAKAAMPAFQAAFGEAVTYARGAQSVALTAIRNSQGVDVVDTQGVYTRVNRTEFLLAVASLVLGGVAVEPQRSDTITDADGKVYDVQAGWEELLDTAEWRVPVREVDP